MVWDFFVYLHLLSPQPFLSYSGTPSPFIILYHLLYLDSLILSHLSYFRPFLSFFSSSLNHSYPPSLISFTSSNLASLSSKNFLLSFSHFEPANPFLQENWLIEFILLIFVFILDSGQHCYIYINIISIHVIFLRNNNNYGSKFIRRYIIKYRIKFPCRKVSTLETQPEISRF